MTTIGTKEFWMNELPLQKNLIAAQLVEGSEVNGFAEDETYVYSPAWLVNEGSKTRSRRNKLAELLEKSGFVRVGTWEWCVVIAGIVTMEDIKKAADAHYALMAEAGAKVESIGDFDEMIDF